MKEKNPLRPGERSVSKATRDGERRADGSIEYKGRVYEPHEFDLVAQQARIAEAADCRRIDADHPVLVKEETARQLQHERTIREMRLGDHRRMTNRSDPIPERSQQEQRLQRRETKESKFKLWWAYWGSFLIFLAVLAAMIVMGIFSEPDPYDGWYPDYIPTYGG